MVRKLSRIVQKGRHDSSNLDKVYPTDTFIVSYPKSGNTWVRFLFANVLKRDSSEVITFHNVHDYCPEWERHREAISRLSHPRIIKSHQAFNPIFPKVIYIVRDARDVYVSYYHYTKNSLLSGWSFADFLRYYDFPHGHWYEHVSSWIVGREDDKDTFKLVHYEDILQDPLGKFIEMVRFAGMDIESERIEAAVESSTFEHMREVEELYGRKYASDGVERFMRIGTSGQWPQYFGEEEWLVFQQKEDVKWLEKLGYEVK